MLILLETRTMKRFLSFIVLCAAFALHSNHASAQTLYSEDFDGGSLASKGFTHIMLMD